MDNTTRQTPRPSGIPRPSRLPVPRTSSLRASPSREALDASTSLHNPKLRSTSSRDQLTSHPTSTSQPAVPIRTPARTSSLRHTPSTATRTTGTTPQPLRLSKASSISGLRSASAAAPSASLRRQSSHQWISASYLPDEDHAADHGPLSPLSPKSSRLSLAERTVETLSRIPPSPAVKGRNSTSFYGADTAPWKPPSRPASRASRSGSSHESGGSRPGSRAGPDDRAHCAIPTPLSPIEATPLRNRRSIPSFTTPSTKTLTTRSSRTSLYGGLPVPGAGGAPRATSPVHERHEKPAAKTLAPRAPTKRPSVNGLSKKPSASALNKSSVSRKTSVVSHGSSSTSGEGTATSVASGSTGITADSEAGQSYKKSSAALREQIAKAKAAKRAIASHADAITSSVPDLELCTDPFNQRRDDKSFTKVLKSRLETARTSGRLNIAALGLKEIPSDVLKMYNIEYIGDSGGSWAESVDVTRFVAADNELEMISDAVFPDVDPQELAEAEDGQGNIFAGLETLDLHGNILVSLPMGLRRLSLLTSLNLSLNRLSNNCLEVIGQITSLKDLKLGGNLLFGTLDPCLAKLENLEILDLHGNNLSSIPPDFGSLSRLRILNISENSFEQLPFETLASLPLTELIARKNQLQGTLIQDGVDGMPKLQILDVSSNQLAHICSLGKVINMPALNQLCLSVNRLQALPDLSGCANLAILAADENNINAIPEGFTKLEHLRSADFSSNDIRIVPNEIGLMESLANLRLSGNPLREKKISTMSTEEIKTMLAQRLEPAEEPAEKPAEELAEDPTPAEQPEKAKPMEQVKEAEIAKEKFSAPPEPSSQAAKSVIQPAAPEPAQDNHDDSRSDLDEYTTPPTSAPASPSNARSQPATWPVKPGGVLDRSNTESSSLHPVICSQLAATQRISEIQLHHNLFTSLPESLTFFAETLTALSLAHNQLIGETYLGGAGGNESLDLPALQELNLSHNHITGLGPLVSKLQAPKLQKLDVSFNRVAALPNGTNARKLRDAFPELTVLLASNNHLVDLEPEAIAGMRVVDVENNDIAHLNPRIGLLGVGGASAAFTNGGCALERLEVKGNRFRVPRWNVLERGTEATLRWLRGRVPVAEMGAWRAEEGEEDVD